MTRFGSKILPTYNFISSCDLALSQGLRPLQQTSTFLLGGTALFFLVGIAYVFVTDFEDTVVVQLAEVAFISRSPKLLPPPLLGYSGASALHPPF